MTFDGKYRMPGQWFWRKLKRVKGDLIRDGKQIIIFENEAQLHLPLTAEVFFSRGRFELIQSRMEEESGTDIKVRK